MSCHRSRLAVLLALLPLLGHAASSEEDLFFKSVSEVNEGELRFLSQPPDKPAHHHQNQLTIVDDSLVSGWVKMAQCHRNIDPVASSQIVYGEDRIRHIRITHSENIGRAWQSGSTVQMENIAPAALICIEAETRALLEDGNGGYLLANGPYMRRFLDGYYPMHVTMRVRLDTPKLRFQEITPAPQAGFVVKESVREIAYDTWFEGRLRTLMRFSRLPSATP